MIFEKSMMNGLARQQWDRLQMERRNHQLIEEGFVRQGLIPANNSGIVPRDSFRDFDNTVVEIMRLFTGMLTDLIPLSRNIGDVGKTVYEYNQISGAGNYQVSMSGTTGTALDKVVANYDGTIVPVQDTSYGRAWREAPQLAAEGYQSLVYDEQQAMITFRDGLVSGLLNGWLDADGNYITHDGKTWQGMRNDPRVAHETLTFDFTDQSASYTDVQNAFVGLINILVLDNKCDRPFTCYCSHQIFRTLQVRSSDFDSTFGTKLDGLLALSNVADIKPDRNLEGNEWCIYPLEPMSVAPVVGQNISVVPVPRQMYNDDIKYVIWSAMGFMVYNDYDGNTCALHAAS